LDKIDKSKGVHLRAVWLGDRMTREQFFGELQERLETIQN